LYRAERLADGRRVLIKSVTAAAHGLAAVAALKREHALMSALAGPGVPRAIAFEQGNGGAALVVDDPGGALLAAQLGAGPWPLAAALRVGRAVARGLDALHAAGISNGRAQGEKGAQRPKPANGDAQTQPRETRLDTAIVWKLGKDNQLIPVQVKTGITDHTSSEVAQVLHGELKPGDQLAIGSQSSTAKKSGGASSPGGMMR
jgi:hypothetical protein